MKSVQDQGSEKPLFTCIDCDKSFKPNRIYLSKALEDEFYTIPPPKFLEV